MPSQIFIRHIVALLHVYQFLIKGEMPVLSQIDIISPFINWANTQALNISPGSANYPTVWGHFSGSTVQMRDRTLVGR